MYRWAGGTAVYEGDWAAGQKHGYCVYTAGAEQWAGAASQGAQLVCIHMGTADTTLQGPLGCWPWL